MKKNPQLSKAVSFFVVAHSDDWQLFMCPNVFTELLEKDSKIIFIITTAGDAGMTENFWRAREKGHKSSVRFCLAPFTDLSESLGIKKIDQQAVHYWSLNNTTTYFLRLPDGSLNGNGFSANNNESLGKFRQENIISITSVDNSAVFKSWIKLVSIVDAIMTFESREIFQKSVHYLNPDTIANPGDHPDHAATGQLLQQIPLVQTMEQFLYVGYSTSNNSNQLPPKDLFWKAGMLAAYEKSVFDGSGYSTLRENPGLYIKWCTGTAQFVKLQATSTIF